MTADELSALEALCEAHACQCPIPGYCNDAHCTGTRRHGGCCCDCHVTAPGTTKMIEAVPRLIAEVRDLRETLQEALGYVPEYFRDKWDLDAPLRRANPDKR